jgi:quinol monooxygenase YgiN
MATLFVRHKVKEFGAWKAAYDAFDQERKTMGVTGQGAYQADDDPNDVTVYHVFESMDAAKAFVGSARLKEVMKNAGVVGDPDIWFTKHV